MWKIVVSKPLIFIYYYIKVLVISFYINGELLLHLYNDIYMYLQSLMA